MDRRIYPVDVISVCNADGQIRPLRLRLETKSQEAVCMRITEIRKVTPISHVGVEGWVFQCCVKEQEREMLVELKYTFRSHSWCLLRRIC